VRRNLDRKSKVESIRWKVDEVIKRSQEEVSQRIRAQKGSFVHVPEPIPAIDRRI
jgi:hypothetical protein